MTSKKRIFAAFFVGNMVFFFFYSLVLWLLTYLRITPYGRFVSEFFKGRTKEEQTAYIEANRALFDEMLPVAIRFSNLFIMPFVGLVAGLVIGMIMDREKKTTGALWALIMLLPVAAMFVARSGLSDPNALPSLAFLLVLTAFGGFLGTGLIHIIKERINVQADTDA